MSNFVKRDNMAVMTINLKEKSVLVFFGSKLPEKNSGWWGQFQTAVAPEIFAEDIKKKGLAFVALENLVEAGNVPEAEKLVSELSRLTDAGGRRIAKAVNFRGFELWWMHYDDLMYRFCLPYTEYKKLLNFLADFDQVSFYNPPHDILFHYFLAARGKKGATLKGRSKKRPSPGMALQAIMSVPFLLMLAFKRPKLMIWTSDLFAPSADYDFRYKFIYESLREKGIRFVEFVRSLEPVSVILSHASRRRRPVVYSYAVINLIKYAASLFGKFAVGEAALLQVGKKEGPEEIFKFMLATHYLGNAKGEIWAILIIKFLLKLMGVKAAIIPAALSRNFCEVLACKLAGIPTIGILHGAPSKGYNVYEFMPNFDGEKIMTVDKYGLWSKWWKDYFIKNSRAYQSDQLFVSGPMRPWQQLDQANETQVIGTNNSRPIRALFVSEHLAAPLEVLPFLQALVDSPDTITGIKFRANQDAFHDWLRTNHPEILKKIGAENIFEGSMHEAIAASDVVVGSHSTGVLESLLHVKPFVFFHTLKWGDCYDLESFAAGHEIYAKNPETFVSYVKSSGSIPREALIDFRDRFFGDPSANGSEWVVEQVGTYL